MAVKQFARADFDQFIAGMKYPPNKFQLAVLESIAFGSGNITVDAKAGSGKTSLLKMIASLLLDMGVDPSEVIFQAFNKSIEEELNAQLPKGFTAKTSHSLGLSMCREYAAAKGIKLGRLSDKKYKDIAKDIAERIHPGIDEEDKRFKAATTVSKLIGFIMANDVDPNDLQAVEELASHYALEVTPAMVMRMSWAINQAIERFEKFGEMDFIDMIYMPVKLKMEPKFRYRYVLVDEAQDLNSLQQEISAKLLHPEGRVIVVGDPAQSVYAFSGADSQAFYNLQKRFNTQVLALNICYRCPTSHIEVAQSLVPSIEAAPNAPAGTIEFKHLDTIASMPLGSMVICRLNAPLFASYFQFIAAEKPAVIIGRDMGKGLVALLDKIADMEGFRYYNISHFIERYYDLEEAKLQKKPNAASKIAQLSDQVACLKVCVENFDCDDLDCFKAKLEALFVDFKDKNLDKSKVVTLCTVHRAKGLEAEHIGLIFQRNVNGDFRDIMPLRWEKQRAWELEQEYNIYYVAVTRAKQTLTVFGGYKASDTPSLNVVRDMPLMLPIGGEEDFEEDEDFELAPENKVVFGFDDEEEEIEDEDWLDESDYARYAPELWENEMEQPSVFALAESADNGNTLLESLSDAVEESQTVSMDSTDIDKLEVVDERLEKAFNKLHGCIHFLANAIEWEEGTSERKFNLVQAEMKAKDFQVAQSQSKDFSSAERDTVLGEENNHTFTWNNVHSRVYNLLADSSKLVEVYNHAVAVLQSFSKAEATVLALSLEAAADAHYTPVQFAEPLEETAGTPIPARELFVYGMSRPAMYGTCPDDYVKERDLIVEALETCNQTFYVDLVVYPRKLSREEMKRYELQPVSENTWDVQIGDKVFTTGRIEFTVMEHLKNGKVIIQVEIDGRKESQIEHQWDLTPKTALADGLAPNPIKDSDSPEGEKPAEAAPVVEEEAIPTEPVEWAKWLIENKSRVLILDTETTDMPQNRDNFEIIQLGVINLDGEVILNRYIMPYNAKITGGAAAVHGITNDVLYRNAATSLITQYQEIKDALAGKIVIAYNSPFDKGALENSLRLCDLPDIEIHSWPDAMRMYAKHNPTKLNRYGKSGTNWSLVEAVAQQGLPVDENAHDALADVKMTLALIQSMAADEPNRWKPVAALPAPKTERAYQVNDLVKVKASGIKAEVKKLMSNGEINIEAVEDGHRQTVSAGMIELVQKAEDRTPFIEETEILKSETEEESNARHDVRHMDLNGKNVRLEDGQIAEVLQANGNQLTVKPEGAEEHVEVSREELFSVITTSEPEASTIIVETPEPKAEFIPVISPKQANPYVVIENIVRSTGSREQALALLATVNELLPDLIDEIFPEHA
jgi:DNA helicase-2/ATP-dependent DNA helicase PcrA